MNRKLYFITFTVGAVIGSVATWCLIKKKYEKIVQEEIDSVKEVFSKREFGFQAKERTEAGEQIIEGFNDDIRQTAEQAKKKPDIAEYAALMRRYGGNVNGEVEDGFIKTDGKKEVMKEKHPYVISPEEFGDFDDYEKISLSYYADGVLADDNDDVVDDVEGVVGDALDHFGEYEEDSVFVRCDERKCDYEILFDQRNFSDIAANKPLRVEV